MIESFILKEEDLMSFAEKVVDVLLSKNKEDNSKAKIILLEGDLGAGKTTFTKFLAKSLGIDETNVHSPTFILKKTYDTIHSVFTKLVHIDAYRFTHPSEASVLRIEEDLKNPQAVIVVEWPSKMSYLKSDIEINFTLTDEDTREVVIKYD